MENTFFIQQLKDILHTIALTEEQKKALSTAIEILEYYKTRDKLIEVAKILTSLFQIGSNLFRT